MRPALAALSLACAIFICVFLLSACVSKKPQTAFDTGALPAASGQPYVILPGNYIIDLAAGARVGLNPQNGDFRLFVSPELARRALRDAGFKGDWRVYRMAGNINEIGEPTGDGQYRLAIPAEVDDWLQ